MKRFFTFVFASCLGTLLFFILIFFIFIVAGATMSRKPTVSNNAILHIKLDGEFKERSESLDKFELIFDQMSNPDLNTIVKAIESAKTDNKVKGLYIQSGFPVMGYSSANRLRTAIQDFKGSGKFVYAYGEFYTPMTYFISSVSDSVFLAPDGIVEITGFANIIPYFKELTDELGVKWNIFYAGDFKSATEPFRLKKMSDENRVQLKEFYNGLYENVSARIIASRDIERNSFEEFVNEFKGLYAENAVSYNLVDELVYQTDFNNLLKSKSGIKEKRKLKLVSPDEYVRLSTIKSKTHKDRIAVLYMNGEIVNSGNKAGQISPEKFEDAFNDALYKDNIKGVVLRVNSPGGSGMASDEINTYVKRIREAGKPVVVSMGDYAASGGYFISAHADKIVADSNTLTGSIGVFALIPELKDMWNNKLKIHFDSVKTHKMSLAISPVFEMHDDVKIMIQEYVDRFYEKFLGVVAEGRNMTRDQVHEAAKGRIWLGTKAKELGLVDELGGLDKAIEICAEMAELTDYSLSNYPRITDNMLSEIIKSINQADNIEERLMQIREIKRLKPLMDIVNDRSGIAEPQARLPFDIEFK